MRLSKILVFGLAIALCVGLVVTSIVGNSKVKILLRSSDTHRTQYGAKTLYSCIDTTIWVIDVRNLVPSISSTDTNVFVYVIGDTSTNAGSSAFNPRYKLDYAVRTLVSGATIAEWDNKLVTGIGGLYYTMIDTPNVLMGVAPTATAGTVNKSGIALGPAQFIQLRLIQLWGVPGDGDAANDSSGAVVVNILVTGDKQVSDEEY